MNSEIFKIRPYARLLTMLGEQLIKNERIALIELIKNSYDADADWVKITFKNFSNDYHFNESSKIIIEDNGNGMSLDVIQKHWLNPATPDKLNRKRTIEKTRKGRIIQGEKGIGRFAILKLGRVINIITKTNDDIDEHVIVYDFSKYDDDFLSVHGEKTELFLEDISVLIENRAPMRIVEDEILIGNKSVKKQNHGTIIEISDLKGNWTENKIRSVFLDLKKFESIFSGTNRSNFDVSIFKNDEIQRYHQDYIEKLKVLLNDKAVIKIENGHFDEADLAFRYRINDDEKCMSLLDPYITGLRVFKERFGNAGVRLTERKIECGSFDFGFYIFDLSNQAPARHRLDKEDKKIVKAHRIYLYRDNIRVYPYGEQDDDWLKIDTYRGTISAGHFLSNDQVVGYINISQKRNGMLKDKTNREGLIEEGNATDDFITLIQTFLSYIRQRPYFHYRKKIENKKNQTIFMKDTLETEFSLLKEAVSDNKKAQELIRKTEREYKAEKKYLLQRAETTEELAGVGLSVETASHDIMGIMSKIFTNIDGIIKDLISHDKINQEALLQEVQSVRGGLSFISDQLKDIQLLFKSSKQRRKNIRVKTVIEKVERIYKRLLHKERIDFKINSYGSPLIAKTTDAVLLQLLLNLFDNAVYWLQQTSGSEKRIEILLDGDNGRLIFSDNGPGINEEDKPYIFEPFFSGKGEEGRGLGLYIARQLLERQDFSIEITELSSDKILNGANFIVSFIKETE